MALSKELWADIREQWEAGASVKHLANKYGVHPNTVRARQKKEEWVLAPTEEPIVAAPVEAPAEVDEADAALAELQAQLAEAQARAEAAEAAAIESAPVVKVPVMTNRQSVIDAVGDGALRDEAMRAVGKVNRQRMANGLMPVDLSDSPEFKAEYEKAIQDRLTAKTRYVSPLNKLRVMKMVKPNGGIVQVPVEKQLNNEAAQEGTALWKAKAKGYKPTDPPYCHAHNCWEFSALDAAGAPTPFNGYCSAEHRLLDPYLNGQKVQGVTTAQIGSFS